MPLNPPAPEARGTTVRTVACPQCGGPSRYAPENRYRPFCSERCKQIDLGAWASESFKLPENEGPGGAPGLGEPN